VTVRKRLLILGGLALFVALATWPAWHALAWSVRPAPKLARPVGATECVAPTEFMRASHMKLLVEWRDRVVRDGVRTYTDRNGRVVTMSLSKTCLGSCHTDKTKFCDRCHDYAGVKPTCWDCHEVSAPPRPSSASATSGGAR
jgi:hypothetical protein